MTELSRGVADAIADVVDFSSFECIVDVGGGRGEFLADLLSNTPAVRGILFDLPHVVLGSPDLLAARGVSDRCEVVGGNMFVSLPQGGDLYIFKNVLLDEEDRRVCAILKACRSVIPASGRVLLIEPLATAPNQPEISLLDITMMVMTGGRKRTKEEYAELFEQTGFRVERSVANRSPR